MLSDTTSDSARTKANRSPEDNFPFGPSCDDHATMDSLRPPGKKTQVVSSVFCFLFAAAVLFVALLMWRNVFGAESVEAPLPWAAPAILTGVALMLSFFAWRILQGDVSTAGLANTPAWFLQLCGIIWLLLNIFILAVSNDLTSTFSLMAMFVGMPCSFGLIFLPGYLRLSRAARRLRDDSPKRR